MYYLMGIDIGTTKLSVCISDLNHKKVSFASNNLETIFSTNESHPSWAFWLPDNLWETVKETVKEALYQIDSADNVRAVAVSGIGYDGLPIDKSGNPLYPIISWHCTRAERQARDFQKSFGRKEIFDITGLQGMACQSIYKMMWLKDIFPEIYEHTYKWLLVEDYINFKLCDAFVTDKTMACSTSLFDLDTQSWSKELIELSGLREDILVDVQDSGTVIGNVSEKASEETGLSCKTLVVLGGHDYMCSALAANSYKQGSVLDIVGTWEMVVAGIFDPQRSLNIYNGGFHISNQVVKNSFVVVGETVSTSMIHWYKNVIVYRTGLDLEKDNTNIWENLCLYAAKSHPIPNGVFFLPHCSGATAPMPDSRSMGAFIGLNDAVETKDFVRALVEGLNFQFYDMLESLSKVMNTTLSKIVCVGEDADNPFLMQNKADVTGKQIEVLGIRSSAVTGASMLAGIGAGFYKNYEEAANDKSNDRRIYEPNLKNMAIYEDGFQLYKKIYKSLKEINWEIFDKFKNVDFDIL